MIHLFLFFVIFCLSFLSTSSTSLPPITEASYLLSRPIHVQLTKKSSSKSLDSTIKTKEKFFESFLKLKPNQLVDLNELNSKLSLLNKSNLFTNLAYTPVVNSTTNMITIDITGEEKPSIVFSPSISINPSRKHPEISGGVSFYFSLSLSLFYFLFLSFLHLFFSFSLSFL